MVSASDSLAQTSIRPAIVYSSQNVEFSLKEKIVKSHSCAKCAAAASDLIRAVGWRLFPAADAIISFLRTMWSGIRQISDKPILLAPNGGQRMGSVVRAIQLAMAIVDKKRYALYCASAHGPT